MYMLICSVSYSHSTFRRNICIVTVLPNIHVKDTGSSVFGFLSLNIYHKSSLKPPFNNPPPPLCGCQDFQQGPLL